MLKISFKVENFLLLRQFLSLLRSLVSEPQNLRVTLMARVALRTLFGTAYPEAARWVRVSLALGGFYAYTSSQCFDASIERVFALLKQLCCVRSFKQIF